MSQIEEIAQQITDLIFGRPSLFREILVEAEKTCLLRALEQTDSLSDAAKLIGLRRTTFHEAAKKHGIR